MSNILHPPDGYHRQTLNETDKYHDYQEYLASVRNITYTESIERNLRISDYSAAKEFAGSPYDTIDELIDRLLVLYYYIFGLDPNTNNTVYEGWLCLTLDIMYRLDLSLRDNLKRLDHDVLDRDRRSLLANMAKRSEMLVIEV